MIASVDNPRVMRGGTRGTSDVLPFVALGAGLGLLVIAFYFDWIALLGAVGFPRHELSNPWVRGDIGVVRGVCGLLGACPRERWTG